MRTFFEQELEKLFGDGEIIRSPEFTGRACVGTIGKNLRVHASFITMGIADHYEGLLLKIVHTENGELDRLAIRFSDVLGRKPVPGNPNFRNGVVPHIWNDRGEYEWYAFHPNETDYAQIRKEAEKFIGAYRERETDGPKLVYICAPLRGDVEKNVEFARQKAREVFASGDVPVCPHLLFPPIADPDNPEQDQAAREMGLRLVESCRQVNVYGPEWTDGMWAEIHHAMKLGIPVMTDQKTIGKAPPRQRANTKERRMTR